MTALSPSSQPWRATRAGPTALAARTTTTCSRRTAPRPADPWSLVTYGRVAGYAQLQSFASAERAAAAFVEAVGERRALAAASGRVAMRPAPTPQPPTI